MLATILTFCGVTAVMTSCSDDDDKSSPAMSDIERQQLEEWEVCSKPTFISGIEGEDPDFQAVINQRFPNQVGTLAEAEVAFLNYATAHAHLDALSDFYNRGGLIVIMRPTETGFDSLGDDYLDDGDDGEEGYFDDDDDEDERFTENEQMDEIFFAYNKFEEHYTMYEEIPFDGNYTDEVTELSEEDLKAIQDYHEQHPDETDNDTSEWLYDNDYDQNDNYFQARIDPFIDFIREISQNTRSRSTRATDDDGNMKVSVEDGYYFVKNIPISLNHHIEDGHCWNKSSCITLKYWVTPAYMLSSNGSDKAGDYYVVKSEIIPHLKPLWEVKSFPGGLFNWGRCRIYAYWFDDMEVEYNLEDEKRNSMEDYMEFYKHPVPDNDNTEVSYSNGFTWGLNGSVGGEYSKEGPKAQINVGFSLEWSSDRSYAIKSIQYERNTLTSRCRYRFWAPSVRLADTDYEDEAATNGNFPAITHTEFSLNTAWMWRLPMNKKIHVADNEETSFYLCIFVKPRFASWYHWRATAQFDGNKSTYNGYQGNKDGWYFNIEQLPAPDRTPWGVVALKNAASSTTVGNIKIYKQSEFSKQGVKAPVYATISSSYNVNEVAKKYLPEGTYTITYQTINPNKGNLVTGNWKYENVEIHQGRDVAEATTEISTINATLIK